ncbi:hypothetical protein [Alkalibacillus haloalkaliphilus]|uniref:hypothetical protein n=1 Tax=Alkalibacillus haloalkaliphilus TaxID=94136 RepID=UPI0002E3E4CF|nr:hypothetical protein [Alkalibacillus haloalkaliphilus]
MLITGDMTPVEVEKICCLDNIEEYFIESYSRNEKLERAYEAVFYSELFAPHKDLVSEIFDCFKLEKYKITIPSAILLVEFAISQISDSNKIGDKLKTEFEIKVVKEQKDYTVDKLSYVSTLSFFSKLFRGDNVRPKSRKDVLHRDSVLHGTSPSKEWTKVDAVMLINALYAFTLPFGKTKGE